MLCLTSCKSTKNVKNNVVTIKGEEYKLAFVDELYPMYEELVSNKEIWALGKKCYEYIKPQFGCYIAYDLKAEPNIYFKSEQFDEALEFYSNGDNYNFFCLRGNIFDEERQQIFELHDIDLKMFDELISFASEKEYNPLTSFDNKDGIISFPINQNSKVVNEIHFYKESKDGAFTTSKGYTFLVRGDKMYLLYYYDYANDSKPVAKVRTLPTELSDYFYNLLKEIEQQNF